MLLFFVDLIVLITLLSLNGNVAQSVERKSHNLKVVSSILTVPTFFLPLFFFFIRYPSLYLSFSISVWAYGAMETHQTSDLRIAGSTPAMLVFLPTLISAYLNDTPLYFSLNGNVAQSVERKSHNLKVVSSILTVPTFFYLFNHPLSLFLYFPT